MRSKPNPIHGLWPILAIGFAAFGLTSAPSAMAQSSSSWLGGWLRATPSPEQMVRGKDPRILRDLAFWTDRLNKNPNDVEALDHRGYLTLEISRTRDLYWSYWQQLCAKDLERAIRLNPKDYFAWHNYGELNFEVGDMWWVDDHSNARRAVWAFTHAIGLNPKSARSYMGRGWAYLTMGDERNANADFRTTLQLDPGLRGGLEQEAAGIRRQMAQVPGARAEIKMMGEYWVAANVHDPYKCAELKGVWAENRECRFSRMFNASPP